MSEWKSFGEHRYLIEKELLRWVNGPAHSAEEIVELCSQAYAISQHYGYALLLIDGTHGGHVNAAGRKAVIEYYRAHRKMRSATAVIGASTATRVAGELLMRAMILLKINSADQPVKFVVDEAAAQRWLAVQRQIFLGNRKEAG